MVTDVRPAVVRRAARQAEREARIRGPRDQLLGQVLLEALNSRLVRQRLHAEEIRVRLGPRDTVVPAAWTFAHDEVAVLKVHPADLEFPEEPVQPLAQPVPEGRMQRAGAGRSRGHRRAALADQPGLRVPLQEGVEIVWVRALVVDAAVPSEAHTGHQGDALGGGVVRNALGGFDATVRIPQEAPDDGAPYAQGGRQVRHSTVVLDKRLGVFEVSVIATEVEPAWIVQDPVGAVVPRPEVRVRQSRFGSRKLPQHGRFLPSAHIGSQWIHSTRRGAAPHASDSVDGVRSRPVRGRTRQG